MGFIAWLILGSIVGILAKWIVPGTSPGGVIVTIIIGILGALIGGFIASAFGLGGVAGLHVGSLIIAVGGAVLLLRAYRRFRR
jgi:uncharacterized membrane protein YeaQ/YmgE (transglycosylase-associated protein family)